MAEERSPAADRTSDVPPRRYHPFVRLSFWFDIDAGFKVLVFAEFTAPTTLELEVFWSAVAKNLDDARVQHLPFDRTRNTFVSFNALAFSLEFKSVPPGPSQVLPTNQSSCGWSGFGDDSSGAFESSLVLTRADSSLSISCFIARAPSKSPALVVLSNCFRRKATTSDRFALISACSSA